MTVAEMFDVNFSGGDLLEWEKADVHMYVETLIHPEKYTQRFDIRPLRKINVNDLKISSRKLRMAQDFTRLSN